MFRVRPHASSDKYLLKVDPCVGQQSIGKGGAYAVMEHGTQYSILLHSNWEDRRCEAEVSVEGKVIASLVLPRHKGDLEFVRLERPTDDDDDRRFTFFQGGSQESIDAGFKEGRPINGNISVLFTPEHMPERKALLHVKDLRGGSLEFHVNLEEDKVEDLKWLLSQKEGTAMCMIRFIFAGKQLEDGFTLSSYNIAAESTVHQVSRLRGGGGSETLLQNGPPLKRFKKYREGITGYTGKSKQRFDIADWFRGESSMAKRLTIKLLVNVGEGANDSDE